MNRRDTIIPVDQAKLDEFMGKLLHDMGAAATGALVVIGDKLGLYKTLAAGGPLSPAKPAARTDTTERYVREWLAAQAAAGYVQYQPEAGRYAMTAEQALALAEDQSPAFVPGAFEAVGFDSVGCSLGTSSDVGLRI